MKLIEIAEDADTMRFWYYEGMRGRKQSNQALWEMTKATAPLLENYRNDMDTIVDILYPEYSRHPERFTTLTHIRDNVCNELGISPLIWDEALAGKPIVPTLAEESHPTNKGELTVKQALAIMHDIESRNILKVCAKMNECEARLFWSRALGEKPCIPVHRFLQSLSHVGGEGRSARYIRRLLTAMSPVEVLALFKGTDPRLESMEQDMLKTQPGVPFMGPYYPAWTKATVPSGVYLDIIRGQRRFLHITEFPAGEWRGVLYSRDGKVVGKLRQEALPVEPGQEYVFEVEYDGTNVTCITDIVCVGEDWDFHNRPYTERLQHADLLPLKVKATKPLILEEGSDMSYTLNQLQDGERARLIDSGSFNIGGEGGWMLMQSALHLHLLLSSVRRNRDFSIEACFSVMDGFEPIEVCRVTLTDGQSYQLRDRLAREGVMVSGSRLDTEQYAVLFTAEVRKVDFSQMTLADVEILHMDDTLGMSDVSQLTDVVELAG